MLVLIVKDCTDTTNWFYSRRNDEENHVRYMRLVDDLASSLENLNKQVEELQMKKDHIIEKLNKNNNDGFNVAAVLKS